MKNYYRELGYGLLMLGTILIATAFFDKPEGPLYSPINSISLAVISFVFGVIFINIGKKYK